MIVRVRPIAVAIRQRGTRSKGATPGIDGARSDDRKALGLSKSPASLTARSHRHSAAVSFRTTTSRDDEAVDRLPSSAQGGLG